MLDKLNWRASNKLGSNHKLIILMYEDENTRVNEKPKYKWKLEEWKKYAEDIETAIPK